jgi:hypothetical protein
MTTTLPRHVRPRDRPTLGVSDRAGEPPLDVVAQPVVGGEFRGLATSCGPLGLPLRGRGAILQLAATRGGVTTQLTRDRRRITAQTPGDLPHPVVLCPQDRDLLTLDERQIASRRLGQTYRWHPATVTEPTRPHRLRHAARIGGLLALHAFGDPLPELPLHPSLVDTWPARRPHRRPSRLLRTPTSWSSHPTPP